MLWKDGRSWWPKYLFYRIIKAGTEAVSEYDSIDDLLGKLAYCCHHWCIEIWG
jgi:hypothetical protein